MVHPRYRMNCREVVILLGWLGFGLAHVIGGITLELEESMALLPLPDLLLVILGLLISSGSILLLVSAWRWRYESTVWRLQLSGLPLAAAGWGVYAVSGILFSPTSAAPLFLGVSFFFASVVQAFAVKAASESTRRNVRNMNRDA